jgi:hypothetical protein
MINPMHRSPVMQRELARVLNVTARAWGLQDARHALDFRVRRYTPPHPAELMRAADYQTRFFAIFQGMF